MFVPFLVVFRLFRRCFLFTKFSAHIVHGSRGETVRWPRSFIYACMCFLPSTRSCTHKYTCGKIIKRTTQLPTAINVETGTPSERSFSVQKTKYYLRDTRAARVLRAPHWAGSSNGPPWAIAPTRAKGKRRERHRKEIAEKKPSRHVFGTNAWSAGRTGEGP